MKSHYIGYKLRKLRGNISQAEVASKVGLSRSYYHNVEHDRRPASTAFLEKIAEYYGISVAELTTADEDKTSLAVALSHINNEHDRVILTAISEKLRKQFQEQCECKQIGVNWNLLCLLKDYGYSVDHERMRRKEPTRYQDKDSYLVCDLTHNTIGTNLRGNWYTYLSRDDWKEIHKATESFLHYMIFTYSESYKQKLKKTERREENAKD